MNMNIRRWDSLGTILEATYHEFWKFVLDTYFLGKLHATSFFYTFFTSTRAEALKRIHILFMMVLLFPYTCNQLQCHSETWLSRSKQQVFVKNFSTYLLKEWVHVWRRNWWSFYSVWRVFQRKLLWPASYERTKQSILQAEVTCTVSRSHWTVRMFRKNGTVAVWRKRDDAGEVGWGYRLFSMLRTWT